MVSLLIAVGNADIKDDGHLTARESCPSRGIGAGHSQPSFSYLHNAGPVISLTFRPPKALSPADLWLARAYRDSKIRYSLRGHLCLNVHRR